MYNPIELSKKTKSVVVNNIMKKYYRFRATKYYGGIATADTVGCNLRCKFCWSGSSVWNSKNIGKYYTPNEVAKKLQIISKKNGYSQVRISGGEPTIGRKHLLMLIDNISSDYLFILETNGILLGYDRSYVKELSKFNNIHVRVCLKGSNTEEFSILTGAKEGFNYQMKAIEYLNDENVSFNIALVSIKKDLMELIHKLKSKDLKKIFIEEEKIILYPMVRKRLSQEGILNFFT
jgi:uncharacterized Fe-S cluster-containing radical SAM superfamily protein